MVCLERDVKIMEENEEKSCESSCGRMIAKTVSLPNTGHLNPLRTQRESRLLAPSVTVKKQVQIQTFICFLHT